MLLYWILLPIVWVLAHILFRFEVIGRENLKAVRDGRAYVIAPNHIANLDPVLIAITIFDWKRLRILAKEELFKNPLAGWFLRCMGAVSIERGKGDTTTVEKLTNECKNGTGIMIFPEGTRTKTGKLGVIKSGAFVIAAAAGADMLPVRIIYGTKDGRLHLFCKLRIVFGEPIPAADLQIRDQSHKMAELRRMKNRLRDELARNSKTDKKTALDKVAEAAERREQKAAKEGKAIHGILVQGIDNCLVKFSRCCTPVPGDDIVGFITRGQGVSIHRRDCENYQRSLAHPEESERWINVSWAHNITDSYVTSLAIASKDRSGLVMDIATVLNSINAKVRTLSARDIGAGQALVNVSLEVRCLADLKYIMSRLASIPGVSSVTRNGK